MASRWLPSWEVRIQHDPEMRKRKGEWQATGHVWHTIVARRPKGRNGWEYHAVHGVRFTNYDAALGTLHRHRLMDWEADMATTWELRTVLALTAAIKRKHGWMDEADAQVVGKPGTAAKVARVLTGEDPCPDINWSDARSADGAISWFRLDRAHIKNLWAADRQLAKDADKWSLTGVTLTEAVSASRLIVAAHNRKLDYWKAMAGSQWVGKPRDRISGVHVDVMHIKPPSTTTMHPDGRVTEGATRVVLMDKNGNAYKWFATDGRARRLAVGDPAIIDTAQISRTDPHEEWKGVKMTRLSYAKVIGGL